MPEPINDDVLGRFLDSLYEKGVSSLYQELAYKVVKHLGLPCKSFNLDATSFHVDGEYDQSIDAQTIRLTQEYSRDHRPDLNQVVLNLITENKAGIPLYRKASSGNTQDVQSFTEIVKKHIKSLKAAYQDAYLIGRCSSLYGRDYPCIRTRRAIFYYSSATEAKRGKVFDKPSEIG